MPDAATKTSTRLDDHFGNTKESFGLKGVCSINFKSIFSFSNLMSPGWKAGISFDRRSKITCRPYANPSGALVCKRN
ncbi:MAG: hypothetical protein AB1847_14930 [bacterium]